MDGNLMNQFRCATYLVPSISVEYFEAVANYLETKFNSFTSLLYESRFEGPTVDRPDPFVNNELDLAWITSSSYLDLCGRPNNIELLLASEVHLHPKNEKDQPGYYMDIIIHKDLKKVTKEFLDFRGCSWACLGPQSFTGHITTLYYLKKMGENINFFGNKLVLNSHLQMIKYVVNQKAHAAAVDSVALSLYLNKHGKDEQDVSMFESWGPLPPHPIVLRKNLPTQFKKKIKETLLNMHLDPKGKEVLKSFKIKKFVPITEAIFSDEKLIKETVKGHSSVKQVYY